MGVVLCRRQKRAASVRFYARVEEEDGGSRCVRYRLLLLPPNADMTERILQRLPQVRIIRQCGHWQQHACLGGDVTHTSCPLWSQVSTAGAVTRTPARCRVTPCRV